MSALPIVLDKVCEGSDVPKYRQASEILIEAIRAGRLAPGAKLPSTKEISAMIDVSLITAHRALEDLVEAGWLRREVGRGTFVRDDVDFARKQDRDLSIALIVEQHDRVNIDDFYHGTLINSLRREAHLDSCHVEFFFHDKFEIRGGKRRADAGVICIHPSLEMQSQVERLAEKRPVVVLGGSFAGSKVACVDCDNALGARKAVKHLLGLGHRRILVISGPPSLSNSRDRTDAAIAELEAAGLEPQSRDLLISRDSIVVDESTKARMESRLTDRDRPTAIFAGGYYLALIAMEVARNVGLTIPHDLSIVGFDDPASAAFLGPPLTTVRQPLEAMAARAYVSVRDALLGAPMRQMNVKMQPELILRGSVAAARPTSSR